MKSKVRLAIALSAVMLTVCSSALVAYRVSIMRDEHYSYAFNLAVHDVRVTSILGTPVEQAEWLPTKSISPSDHALGWYLVDIKGPLGPGVLRIEIEESDAPGGWGYTGLWFMPAGATAEVGLYDLVADRKPVSSLRF